MSKTSMKKNISKIAFFFSFYNSLLSYSFLLFFYTHTDEMSHGTISEITKETSRVFGWEIWLFFFKKLPHFFLKSMYFLLLESVACALKEWYLKTKATIPPTQTLPSSSYLSWVENKN